jgi:Uma2 family endonuclease
MPPAGMEADYRSVDVSAQLRAWARRNGTGKAFGSSVEFILPDGSALSPDAAWVSNERLATVTKQELRRLPHLCPEFVVEVMSPSDRLPAARKKMQLWIANGVELGWLIDGDAKCVYVFRKGCEEQTLPDVESIAGEGPVEGFVLDLREIWEGL